MLLSHNYSILHFLQEEYQEEEEEKETFALADIGETSVANDVPII